jgi:hypothetical protein
MWKQHNFAKLLETTELTLPSADPPPGPEIATTVNPMTAKDGPNRFKMEPAWKNLKSLTLHQFLTVQASTLADRAVFIIGAFPLRVSCLCVSSLECSVVCIIDPRPGFSQSGVTRFISTASPGGFVYLLFVTLASVLAMLSGFLLTALLLFLLSAFLC